MRYRGPRTNWAPIAVTIVVVLVALALLYYLFFAPKPAVVSPTLNPTPTFTQTPVSTSS